MELLIHTIPIVYVSICYIISNATVGNIAEEYNNTFGERAYEKRKAIALPFIIFLPAVFHMFMILRFMNKIPQLDIALYSCIFSGSLIVLIEAYITDTAIHRVNRFLHRVVYLTNAAILAYFVSTRLSSDFYYYAITIAFMYIALLGLFFFTNTGQADVRAMAISYPFYIILFKQVFLLVIFGEIIICCAWIVYKQRQARKRIEVPISQIISFFLPFYMTILAVLGIFL